jgi:hypothetical protein
MTLDKTLLTNNHPINEIEERITIIREEEIFINIKPILNRQTIEDSKSKKEFNINEKISGINFCQVQIKKIIIHLIH